MYPRVAGVCLVWIETYVSTKTHWSLKIYEEKSVYSILYIDYMLEWENFWKSVLNKIH